MDDCAKSLSVEAKRWFQDLGSREIGNLKYREGFAFIAVSG